MFLEYLLNDQEFQTAAPRLRRGAGAYAPSFYAPYVLAAALRDGGARVVVAPDGEAATRLAADLSVFLDVAVPVLPARGVLYGADVAPSPHVVGERQQALTALAAGGVVVVEGVALLERLLPLELQPRPLTLAPGEEIDFDGAIARLAALGYERIEQVRGRGEFAVRGGLIDVYPALGDPLRVEFWGDEVERLRTFSIYSQRTTGEIPRATVFAAFEADTSQPEYVNGLHQAVAEWERAGREETPEELERRAAVRALAALAGRFTTLGELAAAAQIGWAVFNPDETYRALADFDAEVTTAVPGASLRERLYAPLAGARALLAKALYLDVVQRDQPLQFAASRPQFAARDLASAERDLVRLVQDDYRVFVVFRHEGEAERATYRLRNISAEVVKPEQMARLGEAGPGCTFSPRPCATASWPSTSSSPSSTSGRSSARRRVSAASRPARGSRRSSTSASATTSCTRTTASHASPASRPDRRGRHARLPACSTSAARTSVFVPHEQMGKVTRYVGARGAHPSLDKLGGKRWQTVKTRREQAVVELAGELLAALRQARPAVPGFAYPPDERGDASVSSALSLRGDRRPGGPRSTSVKHDMEQPHPMDRLICGDVGFGKTEVAMRAAVKAVEAGQPGDGARADDDARRPAPARPSGAHRASCRSPSTW